MLTATSHLDNIASGKRFAGGEYFIKLPPVSGVSPAKK
jgi:hypothetical protein